MTWSCYRGCAVSLLLSVTLALLARGAPVTENKAPLEDDVGMQHDGMTLLPDPLHELNQETPQLPGGGDKEVQTRSLSHPSPVRLGPKEQGGEEGEQEEELFKDIDPKTLAAVLIEALNQGGEREEGEGGKQRKEGGGGKGGEEVLALLGRQQQEEAAERREEEERLTERVKSRTRSGPGGQEKEKPRGESSSWGKPAADPPSEEKEEEEEEEEEGEEKQGVLTEQELENLEATLREMQRHSAAGEREREQEREKEREEEKEREIAAIASLGKGRGSWADSGEDVRELAAFRGLVQRGGESQEEEEEERERKAPQPRLYHPRFRSEEDEEEAALEAEEEAEQEEVRRQAAEAQRAREEEEKLADVASDLLLQYLTKQGGGAREQEEEREEELEERHSHSNNPHHRQDQRKKNYLLEDNAAEDKRSNEVEVRDEQDDDDIDPQTIDRLIEISSKLHLPADDVVDIITDVEEKKKKKDSAPEPRRRPAPNPAPKPAFHHALNPNTAGRLSSARAPPGRLQVELQRDFKQKTAPEKQQQYPKQKAFMHKASSMYYPRYQPPSYNQGLSVNDILGNSLDYEESWPAPWKYRPQQQQQQLERESYPIPNYIQALRPPPQPRRHFYYPMAAPREQQGGDYYQDTRDKEEELENFIEKILLEHPEVFQ